MRWERWNICGGGLFVETNKGRPFISEKAASLAGTERAGRDLPTGPRGRMRKREDESRTLGSAESSQWTEIALFGLVSS